VHKRALVKIRVVLHTMHIQLNFSTIVNHYVDQAPPTPKKLQDKKSEVEDQKTRNECRESRKGKETTSEQNMT
jgi:hypothetical protein